MSKVIPISEEIAPGGDQGWTNFPQRKINLSPLCAFLFSSAIWCLFIWGAVEGWKHVGRR
jgi:hypothetical protein